MIGIGTYLWNLQNGALAYITEVDTNTYTVLTLNGEVPQQFIINQSEVSSDGSTNWWGTAFYVGVRPTNLPKLGAVVIVAFNGASIEPPNPPLSVLDSMSLSSSLLTRNEYKTVYGYLALDADPSTAVGFLASSLDGLRAMFIPNIYYDYKLIIDGTGP